MSFSDPMQENAVTAIEKCHLAGVRVNHCDIEDFRDETVSLRLF